MNVMYLTRLSPQGAEFLRQMKIKGIVIKAIVLERPGRYSMIKELMRQWGSMKTIKIILRTVLNILVPMTREHWLRRDYYYGHSGAVYTVEDFNGKQCEQLLKDIRPDIIALGSSPILRSAIIAIPNIGILNAHPGLLPKYRGVDTVEWAIYNGDEIGVTIHFVDQGVDSGNIIVQKTINIKRGDSIQALRQRIWTTAGELMAEIIIKIAQEKHVTAVPQRIENGKQYYRMPRKLVREVKRKLQEREQIPCRLTRGVSR